jgi:hypothetical protein
LLLLIAPRIKIGRFGKGDGIRIEKRFAKKKKMSSLNRFYLDEIAPVDSQSWVDFQGGNVNAMPTVTTAAVAWLLTGRDVAPPFSDAWAHAPWGTGPEDRDRMIAYAELDDTRFEDATTLLVLIRNDHTLVLDSHHGQQRGLTIESVGKVPEPSPGHHARHILLL